MNPIITITFNPCVDKSFDTDRLLPEKKLRCGPSRYEPGGGGINVARAIHRLGGKATAVYPSGGYHGALLTEMLAVEGIDTHPVAMLVDIRENINVRETSTGRQYRFIEPGPVLTDHNWTRCVEVLNLVDKGGVIVVSGSLAAGCPEDLWKRIKQVAQRKSARLVVDVTGKVLRQALEQHVYMIKPSEEELLSIAGEMGLPGASPEKIAGSIVALGQAEVVVVSRGAAGATIVTPQFTRAIDAPVVEKQSTVGAGDSLVAGILVGLSRKMELTEAVRFGVACGTAAVMNPGTALFHAKDAEALYTQMKEKALTTNNTAYVKLT